MIYKLFKVEAHTPTSGGMRYALSLFLLGLLTGALLLGTLQGLLPFSYRYLLDLHLSFMLFGWVVLLIASVAFQVIEMFFVTPPYPKLFSWGFPPLVSVLLLAGALSGFNPFTKLLLSLSLLSFALVTAFRLRGRRRKIPDPLVSLWYVGMLSLAVSSVLYPLTGEDFRLFLLFLFAFGTFAHSVILAMMYRIIPFLVWIHLSNRGILDAPTMHEVIRPGRVWLNFYLHAMSVLFFLISFFFRAEPLWFLILTLYLSSFATLFLNLSSGLILYLRRASGLGASPRR